MNFIFGFAMCYAITGVYVAQRVWGRPIAPKVVTWPDMGRTILTWPKVIYDLTR
jgi:hypothetical protein